MKQKYLLKTSGFYALCTIIAEPTEHTVSLQILEKRYHGEKRVFRGGDEYAIDRRDKTNRLTPTNKTEL